MQELHSLMVLAKVYTLGPLDQQALKLQTLSGVPGWLRHMSGKEHHAIQPFCLHLLLLLDTWALKQRRSGDLH